MPVQYTQPIPPPPPWRKILLAGVSQMLLENVIALITCDEGRCKGHRRLGNRLSGAVEDESCGLGRLLYQ